MLAHSARLLRNLSVAVALVGSSDARADVVQAPSIRPPLSCAWMEQITLPDGNIAVVMPPVGAREPRPVVVAVHGAGDRAEWACGGWRIAMKEYAFVVCPQGLKMDPQRFAWDSSATIARRVTASLAAVRSRYGAYVAEGPAMYVGFSQGATLAEPALLETKGRFSTVVFAEGGYDLMRNASFLRRLRSNGTSRALIVCGSPNCFRSAALFEKNFSRAGFDVSTAGDPLSGHNLNKRMQDALLAAWPAFVKGDGTWKGLPGPSARE